MKARTQQSATWVTKLVAVVASVTMACSLTPTISSAWATEPDQDSAAEAAVVEKTNDPGTDAEQATESLETPDTSAAKAQDSKATGVGNKQTSKTGEPATAAEKDKEAPAKGSESTNPATDSSDGSSTDKDKAQGAGEPDEATSGETASPSTDKSNTDKTGGEATGSESTDDKGDAKDSEADPSAEAVFALGDSTYATIKDAAAAAKTGDTIKLLKDVDLTGSGTTHLDGITLDLDGHTISANNFSSVFCGNDMTLQNGTFSAKGGAYGLFIGDNPTTSNVLLKNLTIDGGINIFNTVGVVIENVNADDSNAKTPYYAVWCDINAQATIKSGSFKSTGPSVVGLTTIQDGVPESTLTIEGGDFQNDPVKLALDDGKHTRYVPTITGGTFADKANAELYVSEGSTLIDGTDGKVSIVQKTNESAEVQSGVQDSEELVVTTLSDNLQNEVNNALNKDDIKAALNQTSGTSSLWTTNVVLRDKDTKKENHTTPVTFVLPYPDDVDTANYKDYQFTVMHVKMNEADDGTLTSEPEILADETVSPTAKGLKVTSTLSPFVISYQKKEPATNPDNPQGGNTGQTGTPENPSNPGGNTGNTGNTGQTGTTDTPTNPGGDTGNAGTTDTPTNPDDGTSSHDNPGTTPTTPDDHKDNPGTTGESSDHHGGKTDATDKPAHDNDGKTGATSQPTQSGKPSSHKTSTSDEVLEHVNSHGPDLESHSSGQTGTTGSSSSAPATPSYQGTTSTSPSPSPAPSYNYNSGATSSSSNTSHPYTPYNSSTSPTSTYKPNATNAPASATNTPQATTTNKADSNSKKSAQVSAANNEAAKQAKADKASANTTTKASAAASNRVHTGTTDNAASAAAPMNIWAIMGGILALAAAAGLIIFFVTRRKNDQGDNA